MRVFGDAFSEYYEYYNIASMKDSYPNAKFQPKRSMVIKNKQRIARKKKGKKK